MVKTLTLKYVVGYIVFFVFITWLFNVLPSNSIEEFTAQTAAGALSFFGHTTFWEQVNGYTTLTLVGQNVVTVSIIRECTALNVLGVMTGLILPLRASWIRRLTGVGLAGLMLFTLNIPRIALTVYLTAYATWPFSLIAQRSLETYHYPISFGFGVIGMAITVLAVSKWTTPELSENLLNILDWITDTGKKEKIPSKS